MVICNINTIGSAILGVIILSIHLSIHLSRAWIVASTLHTVSTAE